MFKTKSKKHNMHDMRSMNRKSSYTFKVLGIFVGAFLLMGIGFFVKTKSVHATTATMTLVPSTTSTSSLGESFTVDVNIDTGGNDVVVSRAIIRFNYGKVAFDGWDTTNSAFATNNNLCLQASGTGKNAGDPCKIEDVNLAANGIATITMATPHQNVVNGSGLLVARANFHTLVPSISNVVDKGIMGLKYRASNYTDSSNIINDDISGNGADILSAPAQQSTVQYGDLNGDGAVNSLDLGIIHYDYGKSGLNSATGNNCGTRADINSDCGINSLDLGIVHFYYGTTLP